MKTLLTALFLFFITGCGTTLHVHKPYVPVMDQKITCRLINRAWMPQSPLDYLHQRLVTLLHNHNMLAEPEQDATCVAEITILEYRMRDNAVRALVGIFAGTDSICSLVQIKDKKTERVMGSFDVKSSNATAVGSTHWLIDKHAGKIIQGITGYQKSP